MAISNTARILIVAVVVVLVVVVVLMFRDSSPKLGGGPGAKDSTDVILGNDGNGRCRIDSKEQMVTTKAGQKFTWNINHGPCNFKDEIVTVGNFRYTETSAADNCREPVEGNAVWPFVEPRGDIRHRQNTTNPNKIELHIRPSNELPGTPEKAEYYYDICTGVKADVKSDPMLVIEK